MLRRASRAPSIGAPSPGAARSAGRTSRCPGVVSGPGKCSRFALPRIELRGTGKLLEELAFLLGELAGHHDLGLREEVAWLAARIRQATSAQPEPPPARRAAGDLDGRLAAWGLHRHRRAQRAFPRRHGEVDVHIATFDAEPAMGRYPHDQVEVARLGPSGPLTALPREANALAVG